jgi:hypothetical protein
MHDITRERILRKLETLPDEQLYQVLDFIEFLEARYAAARARRPDSLQLFAERLEDGMRMRSVAPKVISGTIGLVGTAQKVFRTVTDAGRDMLGELMEPATTTHGSRPTPPAVEAPPVARPARRPEER